MVEKTRLLESEGNVTYEVVYVGRIGDMHGNPLPHDVAEAHLDRVMTELVKLAEDPAVSMVGSTGQVEISVAVQAEDPETAVEKGSAVIRTAAHAAGGSTPNWSVDWCEARAVRRTLVDA